MLGTAATTRKLSYVFDHAYVARLRGRDSETESHFAAHFGRVARIMLRRRLRAPEAVQDACQEALMRCLEYFRAGKPLDHPERLAGFVHSMCHNVAMEMIRAGTRHSQLAGDAPDSPATGPSPEDEAVNEERKRVVRDVLRQLPAKDRELLRSAFLEEEDRDELCRRFQTTEGYLRVLLHRARERFRAALLSSPAPAAGPANAKRQDTLARRKSQSV